MFSNLVESDSHRADYRRKSSIFLGTMAAYALLLLAAAVTSVYAYDARLETQNQELALVTFIPIDSTAKPPPTEPRDNRPRTATTSNDNTPKVPVRPVLISSTENPLKVPDKPGTASNNIPPAPPNAIVGPSVVDPPGIGTPSDRNNSGVTAGQGNSSATNPIREELPEPPEIKKPKSSTIVSLGVINSKALKKPSPPYPPLARKAHISGTVTVRILLDETGKVISARATDGHPLLQHAAIQAAYQAQFTPTMLSKQPVKATGIITYHFMLQ
jgi:protein TonB